MDLDRHGFYLLVAIGLLVAGAVRVFKLHGRIDAWKMWLGWILACMVVSLIMCLTSPPVDIVFCIGLCIFASSVLAIPLSAMTFMICPSLEVRYPWTDFLREQRRRRDYEAYLNSDFGRWFTAQENALSEGHEIEPPWIAFPNQDPWWIGWRQGNGEGWIKEVWYPYWKRLETDQRRSYLDKWDAPDDWCEYIDPDRDTSKATIDLKQSLGGFVMNLWLKDTADNIEGSNEDPGALDPD